LAASTKFSDAIAIEVPSLSLQTGAKHACGKTFQGQVNRCRSTACLTAGLRSSNFLTQTQL